MPPKKKILLVTSGFPYGNTERGFISTEFRHLTENFQVYLLSIGSTEPLLYDFPEEVELEPVYEHTFVNGECTGCGEDE